MMTTDIYTAVCKDQDRFLKQLMGVGTGLYNVQLWEGTKIWPGIARRMTCIQLAVREGSTNVLKMLVQEAKLDINYGQATTALTTALEYKQHDMMTLLIEHGAQVNKAIMHGYSGMGEGWVLYSYPINMSLSLDNVLYLRLLLEHGADPLKEYSDFSSVNKYHTTVALLEAVRKKKHLHCVILLQFIATLEKDAFGMHERIFEHCKTAFNCLTTQDNSETLLELFAEMGGNCLTRGSSQSMVGPLKLKQFCRKTIRKFYRAFLCDRDKNGFALIKVLTKLPLPVLLTNYLLLTEEVGFYDT